MKKLITLALVVALSAGAVITTGCGGASSAPASKATPK